MIGSKVRTRLATSGSAAAAVLSAVATAGVAAVARAVETGAPDIEALETGEHAEPFYATAEFWVAVAFILFVAVTGRTVYRVVTVALDDRAERIKNQIDEATRFAAEAQDLLASYERKQQEAEEEARDIVERARREADRLTERAGEDLENALKRREELAMERLAQAEQAAVAEVRGRAVEIAMAATARVLAEHTKGAEADALIDKTIEDLPAKLRVH